MEVFNAWIMAFRMKTLPLSVSGIIISSFIALVEGSFKWTIFLLALVTTLFLQILSNLANDYGDGVKGTDVDRVGSQRAVESGVISAKSMLIGVVVLSVLSFVSGVLLLLVSFGSEYLIELLVFLFIGVSAIIAAIKYTVGKSAYGYSGMGDAFVFVFFGLVSVVGTYILYAKEFNVEVVFPAISIGLLSTGVLNLNNLRDFITDKKANKNTLVVKIGVENGKKYHVFIIITAVLMSVVYMFINYNSVVQFLFLVLIVPLVMHLKRVFKNEVPKNIEPELKFLALTTLLFAFLFGIGLYLSVTI